MPAGTPGPVVLHLDASRSVRRPSRAADARPPSFRASGLRRCAPDSAASGEAAGGRPGTRSASAPQARRVRSRCRWPPGAEGSAAASLTISRAETVSNSPKSERTISVPEIEVVDQLVELAQERRRGIPARDAPSMPAWPAARARPRSVASRFRTRWLTSEAIEAHRGQPVAGPSLLVLSVRRLVFHCDDYMATGSSASNVKFPDGGRFRRTAPFAANSTWLRTCKLPVRPLCWPKEKASRTCSVATSGSGPEARKIT